MTKLVDGKKLLISGWMDDSILVQHVLCIDSTRGGGGLKSVYHPLDRPVCA